MTKDGTPVSEEQSIEAGEKVEVVEEAGEAFETNGQDEAPAAQDSGDEHAAEGEEALNEAQIIERLQEELAAARAERDEAEDRRLREAAEFQNVRKRQERQLIEQMQRANTGLILQFLPVLDDLDLAFRNAPSGGDEADNGEEQAWIAGFEQIRKKLLGLLEEQGVTPIDANGEFDPSLHEAVLSEASDEVESGHVISVLRTGYTYKGQVLRPAMVRVAA